jgi:diguanylate cyclase (GGDEF)-like protein
MPDGKRTSEVLTGRPSYRPEQSTLIDDIESPSLVPKPPTEKNRGLLTLLTGPLQGTIIKLDEGELTLGRGKQAGALIPDQGLSRIHARVFRRQRPQATDFYIEDCGSTNGTFVGGHRITQPTALHDGVRIGLGRRTALRFSLQDDLEEQALIRVHESALRDRLTGAYNRGVFDDRLHSEFAYSRRRQTPLAVMLFDIDHFKKLNDTHGHQAGDAVLKGVAEVVQSTVRSEDVFARYGGEEFAVIARGISQRSAHVLAERIRMAIEDHTTNFKGVAIRATVSVGVIHVPSTAQVPNPASLVASADACLYEAKHQGRNRVVMV